MLKFLTLKNSFNFFLFVWVLFIPMKTSFYPISYVAMVLIFLYYIFIKKHIISFKNLLTEYRTLIIYFFFIILSMTISNTLSPISTFPSWAAEFNYLFRYFLIFLILIFFYKENLFTKRFLLICIFFSLFIQGIDGVSSSIFHLDFIKGHMNSLATGLKGATSNRNTYGMLMSVGSSMCIGFLFLYKQFSLKKKEIFTLLCLLALLLYGLFFSYSRASWLFLIVFVFSLLAANYKKINKYHILYLLISIILISILFLSEKTLLIRFHSLIVGYSSNRFELWNQAIELIKNNFLFGYGLMTYHAVGLKSYSGVHNSILEIFLFLGLFGFIAYTNLLLYIFKQIILSKNNFYMSIFFSFLIITQFDNSIVKGMTTLSTLTLFAFFIFSNSKKC